MTPAGWFGLLSIAVVGLSWYSIRCADRAFDRAGELP